MAQVRFEPVAPRSPVKHSTTEPLPPILCCGNSLFIVVLIKRGDFVFGHCFIAL